MTALSTDPAQAARPGTGLRVALFATCINDVMFPGTPKAVVQVLERLGCTVEFPLEQTCCGQMFTNTGYYDEAVPDVRNYDGSWTEWGNRVRVPIAVGDEPGGVR